MVLPSRSRSNQSCFVCTLPIPGKRTRPRFVLRGAAGEEAGAVAPLPSPPPAFSLSLSASRAGCEREATA